MCAYTFSQDLILLYPLYAVLFADTGLSTAQISSLFVVWSVSGVVLEIPSGVLADTVPRRLLLTVSPVLAAAAFGLWTLFPSYAVFAVGFVLWGAGGALQSGALEALVYEELDRHAATSSYARVIGLSRAASTVAVVLGMAIAGPVLAVGGYHAVGAASVGACLLSATVAAGFPERRHGADAPLDDRQPSAVRSFAQVLWAGLVEVRTQRAVWSAVTFLVVISAIWGALDEYVALLAVDTGVTTERIPLLLVAVYAGAALGGLLAGAARRLSRAAEGVLLTAAAVALAAGALVGHPAGFGLVGAAFCVFQMVEIGADAELQRAMAGTSRSTVTSLAGFGTEIATIGVFVTYAAVSPVAGHGAIFAGWSVAYVLVAVVWAWPARRRVKARLSGRRQSTQDG